MKERPILFSAPMVRANLDGSKTQTRRVVKRPKFVPIDYILNPSLLVDKSKTWWGEPNGLKVGYSQYCPYGQPGDRLWVRETHAIYGDKDQCVIHYKATNQNEGSGWRPSIHMPRWASRILLEVVSVRVERLQDISEEDAKAEGVQLLPQGADGKFPTSYRLCFAQLWDSIHGPGSWAENPYVWVVTFKRIKV